MTAEIPSFPREWRALFSRVCCAGINPLIGSRPYAPLSKGPTRDRRCSGKSPGFTYWDMVMPPYCEMIIPRLIALKLIDTHRDFYGVEVPPLPPVALRFHGSPEALQRFAAVPVAHGVEQTQGPCGSLTPELIPRQESCRNPINGAPQVSPSEFPKARRPKFGKRLHARVIWPTRLRCT